MNVVQKICVLLTIAAAVTYAHSNDNRFQHNDMDPDPDMEQYLREALENFRDQMKKGIPAIHMPSLDPLKLRNLDINVNENLATMFLRIKEIKVQDLSTFVVHYIRANLETFYLKLKLSIPILRGNGQYRMDGKILKIFPLYGNGSFSINATGVEAIGFSQMEIVNETLQAKKMEFDLSWNDLEIYLENLLGGQKFAKVLQRMLPRIGKNCFEAFKPQILGLMNEVFTNSLNNELQRPEVKKIIEGLKPPS